MEELDPGLCARYLEYLIQEREEMSILFHDRLAELYLEMAISAGKNNDNGKLSHIHPSILLYDINIDAFVSIDKFDEAYEKLMDFIQTSDIYRVDRLLGLLPSDGGSRLSITCDITDRCL